MNTIDDTQDKPPHEIERLRAALREIYELTAKLSVDGTNWYLISLEARRALEGK